MNEQEATLRKIAGLCALLAQGYSNTRCSKCEERETLVDCIRALVSGYSDQVDVM